jgi:hypothetical protein
VHLESAVAVVAAHDLLQDGVWEALVDALLHVGPVRDLTEEAIVMECKRRVN